MPDILLAIYDVAAAPFVEWIHARYGALAGWLSAIGCVLLPLAMLAGAAFALMCLL